MQKLKGLQYAITLDLKVWYYTIIVFTSSQVMIIIVTVSVKFLYNRLHMGIRAYGGVFQWKLDKLHGVIEVVKTYVEYILFLSNESLYKHEKMKVVFSRLFAAGLKVTFPK